MSIYTSIYLEIEIVFDVTQVYTMYKISAALVWRCSIQSCYWLDDHEKKSFEYLRENQ